MAHVGKPSISSPWRAWLTTAVLALGFVVFLAHVDKFYPVRHWLFFRYARYWALSLLLSSACMTSGMRLVALLGAQALCSGEYLLLAFAAGVFLFGLGVFVGGLLGLYGGVFFFAWPVLLLLAAGAGPWRHLTRLGKQLMRAPDSGEPRFWPRTPSELARAAFLVLSLVGVYLQVITPENVSFDSRWYHLGIAEQYAAQGAIRRFPEGWYLGAYPQLATWLYTWAFQQPGSLFDRVSLASHLEWTLFLATVPGIGLLARHLVPHTRLRWTGAALFLFPSLILYDTNLTTSADHVLAFWAAPFALSVIAAASAPSARRVLLAAIPAAGALLTRYQAIYLILPASLFMLVALARAGRLRLLLPGVAALLVLTAPHWLKNVIYYGDPLYPMLHAYLPSHPFHAGAADALLGVYVPTRFNLTGSLAERVRDTLYALPTFAFTPHNWDNLELPQPTFGSVFSLLGLALPFLARAGRIWVLTLGTYLGITIWFWTNHQDRFLQALLPWMAACIVALCARIWTLGSGPKLALSALLALQLVWGADFYFSPNHTIINDSILISLTKHLRAGMAGRYDSRFHHWGDHDKLNRLLPRDAVLLMHKGGWRLGLDHSLVSDEYGYQGALSYTALRSAPAIWQAWHDLGVTHVLWRREPDRDAGAEERAREAIFRAAVKKATRHRRRVHGSYLAELAPNPPDE